MSIESPVQDGLITDWDALEAIWEYSLEKYVKIDPKNTPVLFAEKPYNPPKNRHKVAELMFEKYGSPALFLAKDAVLSCYSCGKTTALVVDIGASGTVTTPILDGWFRETFKNIL